MNGFRTGVRGIVQRPPIFVLAIARLLMAGIGSISFVPLAIRAYSVAGTGRWVSIVAIYAVAAISELGLTTALARSPVPSNEEAAATWRAAVTWLTASLLVTTICTFAFLVFGTPGVYEVGGALTGLGNTVSILAVAPASAFLIAHGDSQDLYRLLLVTTTLRTVALVALTAASAPPIFVGTATLTTSLLGAVWITKTAQALGLPSKVFAPTKRISRGIPVFRFGALASTGTASDLATHQLGRFVLGASSGYSTAAYFAAITSIGQGIQQLGSILNAHVLAVSVQLRTRANVVRDRQVSRLALQYMMLPVFAGGVVTFAPETLLEVLLDGNEAASFAPPMQGVVVAILLNLATSPLVILLLAQGRATLVSLITGASALTTAIAMLLLVPRSGIEGAALAVVAGAAVAIVGWIGAAWRASALRLVLAPGAMILAPLVLIPLARVQFEPLRIGESFGPASALITACLVSLVAEAVALAVASRLLPARPQGATDTSL